MVTGAALERAGMVTGTLATAGVRGRVSGAAGGRSTSMAAAGSGAASSLTVWRARNRPCDAPDAAAVVRSLNAPSAGAP